MASTCLITGSTGIGAATAKALAGQGWQLFVVSRTESHGRLLVKEIRDSGGKAECLCADLTEPDSAAKAVRACVSAFGRLDALYNVAGISGRKFGDGPLLDCTDAGWETVLNTNAQTQLRLCRETVRQMLAQEPANDGARGVILNMASILGIDPDPSHFNATAYAASKGAIIALTRHLAASLAKDKIRVNAIAPGLVRTAMSARASEAETILEHMQQKQPLYGGLIPVEDVAGASMFLLSSAARAITGQVLLVDGGWSVA